jgi:serine/threonine-protein kinase
MQQPGIIGTRVDRYLVERLLGAGGFGSVYRAKHVHTESIVALKLLKKSLGADQQMLDRFLREARAAASVGSEHIVRVTDAGMASDGQAFLALEYLDGLDLKELAAQQGPLPHQRVVMVVLQALEALEAAHAKGIVHRDMKPANVFVVRRRDERGTERDFVKLLDFGISKMHGDAATSGLTMTGVAMGTPSYMAPEQFFDARSVDGRADLYSVSAMLYELLSGQLPFDAESYAHLIVKVRTEQALPLNQIATQVPLPLAQVVMVGLAKEPHQRWQSAREFGDALRSALGLPPPGGTPAFLPTQSGAQPVVAMKEPDGLDKTHTPAPRPSQPATPAPLPAPAQAGWVIPSSGSANTGFPIAPAMAVSQPPGPAPGSKVEVAPSTGNPMAVSQPSVPAQGGRVAPQPGTATGNPMAVSQPPVPAQGGWVAPTGAATGNPMGASQPPVKPPQQKSSALKWFLIIMGLLFLAGGCCTCGLIAEAAKSSSSPSPAPTQPPVRAEPTRPGPHPTTRPTATGEPDPDPQPEADTEADDEEPDPDPAPAKK